MGFNLNLCADASGLRVGTHTLVDGGAFAGGDIQLRGDNILRMGSRKCCAPLDVLLQPGSGSHEFVFVIHSDPGCGAGVGVIAEGAHAELPSCRMHTAAAAHALREHCACTAHALRMHCACTAHALRMLRAGVSTELPSCWPNSGVADLWWLRRNGGEVYSQSQLEGDHPPIDLHSEIRMVVDTDAGTVRFFVNGTPPPPARCSHTAYALPARCTCTHTAYSLHLHAMHAAVPAAVHTALRTL